MIATKPTRGNQAGKRQVEQGLDELKPTQFMVPESQRRKLKDTAHETGVSQSQIVREAIDNWFAKAARSR